MNERRQGRVLTPNQVVGYNLRRAREYRGWTLRETSERLERFGLKWSESSLSVAEHSWEPDPRRVREFDANEIVALARTFGVSIRWFFLPPDPTSAEVQEAFEGRSPLPSVSLPGAEEPALSGTRLLESLLASEDIMGRLRGLRPYLGEERFKELQDHARDLILSMVGTQAGRLDEWAANLESLAGFLHAVKQTLLQRIDQDVTDAMRKDEGETPPVVDLASQLEEAREQEEAER